MCKAVECVGTYLSAASMARRVDEGMPTVDVFETCFDDESSRER